MPQFHGFTNDTRRPHKESAKTLRLSSVGSALQKLTMANLPDAPVDHEPPKDSVRATLDSLSDLFSHAIRPLPTETGDGTYIEPTLSTGLLRDLEALNIQDVDTLNKVVKEKFNNNGTNDKNYLMERVIQVGSSSYPLLNR